MEMREPTQFGFVKRRERTQLSWVLPIVPKKWEARAPLVRLNEEHLAGAVSLASSW